MLDPLTAERIRELTDESCIVCLVGAEDHPNPCADCQRLMQLRDLALAGMRVPRLLEMLRLLLVQVEQSRRPHPWLVGAIRNELKGITAHAPHDLASVEVMDSFGERIAKVSDAL